MNKVFIDGQSGTTGLQIQERLAAREDIALLEIDDKKRKDPIAKTEILNEADVTILCLPDDAAIETVALAAQTNTRILDASTAYRVANDWAYGLPELGNRKQIQAARCVSNPGCYPTGFLLAVTPLIDAGIIDATSQLNINAVSGYSGGGKSMIKKYQARNDDPLWVRPYALSFGHKHVPEMTKYAKLERPPLFTPSVGHYYQGMLVSVALSAAHTSGKIDIKAMHGVLDSYYASEPCVIVHDVNDDNDLEEGFLDPQRNNGTNRNDIYLFGDDHQVQLISVLDNLGKGASGAAVQNLNLMLGVNEFESLRY